MMQLGVTWTSGYEDWHEELVSHITNGQQIL